jgi:all-trans-8'-apo-beta-carotenal 15,15'-oxygenase
MSLENVRSGAAFGKALQAPLVRGLIDLEAGTLERRLMVEEPSDFPTTAPSAQTLHNRFVFFLLTREGRELVARYDTQTGELVAGDPGPARVVGEATFVPHADKGGEADGWLLAAVYDAARDRSGVSIFNGLSLQDGPVGTVWFDHRIPMPLHGIWVGG